MISEEQAIRNFIKVENFSAISIALSENKENVCISDWLFLYDILRGIELGMEESSKSIHAHPAYFGSELACPECNPFCHQNHGMGKVGWCGDKDCPIHPRHFEEGGEP